MLYRRFPEANEGELDRRSITLVRGETCAVIARGIGLGELTSAAARPTPAVAESKTDPRRRLRGGDRRHLSRWRPRRRPRSSIPSGPRELGQCAIARADAKTDAAGMGAEPGPSPPAYVEVDRAGPDHARVHVAVQIAARAGARPRPQQEARRAEGGRAFLVREKVWRRPD